MAINIVVSKERRVRPKLGGDYGHDNDLGAETRNYNRTSKLSQMSEQKSEWRNTATSLKQEDTFAQLR